MVDHVAHDDGHEHRTDVNGEAEAAEVREQNADDVADAGAEHQLSLIHIFPATSLRAMPERKFSLRRFPHMTEIQLNMYHALALGAAMYALSLIHILYKRQPPRRAHC